MSKQPVLTISTSPYVLEGGTTPGLMMKVVYALIPVLLLSCYFFGVTALLLVGTTVIAAVGTEWLFDANRKGLGAVKDGSALLTGVLLGLTLPPAIPLWMAFLGGFTAIALGKLIWGGLGYNMFNPALLGRAFLQAAFPEAMTTWVAPSKSFFQIDPSTLAMPLMHGTVDAVTSATPLGLAKFEKEITSWFKLALGDTGGSLGETSALLLILCGLWLGFGKVFNWRGPVATLLSVFMVSGLLHLVLPERCPPPHFMLLSGGLLFGCVFMVTDPVTTPITSKGLWIFGAGLGALIVVIRIFGGLPEAVMFSILLMNAVTPHINRYTQPRQFGG